MKKLMLVVILDQYADWEAAYISSAIYMLGNGMYEIKTISLKKELVKSIGGFSVMPDYDIESVPEEYDAMLLIGGMSWRNKNALQIQPLVKECYSKGKILGGICDAAGFLAVSGVLNEVRHTANGLRDIKAWAKEGYTGDDNYCSLQAVRDENVVTANGTGAMEFAKEVLLALEVTSKEKIEEWYNFHKLGYYTAPLQGM